MTVIANGRTVVHQESKGKLSSFDVCLTPIPIPFNNIAQSKHLAKAARTVFVNGYPLAHQKSVFYKSKGDAGGIMLGIKSHSIEGKAEFLQGSANVFVESFPVVRQGEKMVSNNRNTPPAPLMQPGAGVPPQIKAKIEKAQKQLQTNYVLDIDVVGNLKLSAIFTSLVAFSDSGAGFIGLGRAGDKDFSNSITRRLHIYNLPNQEENLALRLINTQGAPIDIPLTYQEIPLRNKIKTQEPKSGQAGSVLVPCTFAWDNHSVDNKLTPQAGDFTDIARFPDDLRERIYKQLQTKSGCDLQEKPWTELIGSSLIMILQHQMQSKDPASEEPIIHVDNLKEGWLYIYKQGYLWREIKLNENGTYSDVNLTKYAGQERRLATAVMSYSVIIPEKINAQVCEIEIAYSPVQWSWARINLFGGMAGDDPRIVHKADKVPMANNASARTLRAKRMTMIDLSAFVKANATRNQTMSGPSEDPSVKLLDKSMMPVILLPDPVGLAKRIVSDIHLYQHKLKKMLQAVHQHNYFKSAYLTYKVYFDKQYSDRKTSANTKQPENTQLNKDKIEQILKTNERQALRKIIQLLQVTLIQLVFDPNGNAKSDENHFKSSRQEIHWPKIESISTWYNRPLAFSTAMEDYFSAGIDNYTQGFLIISTILCATLYHPHLQDRELDINDDSINKQMMPGLLYACSLFDKINKLHKMLFPSMREKAAVKKKEPSTHTTSHSVINTGDGAFNAKRLQAAIQTSAQARENAIHALESFVFANIALLESGAKSEIIDISKIVHLAVQTGIECLQRFSVKKLGTIKDDESIMAFEHENPAMLSFPKILPQPEYLRSDNSLTSRERQIINTCHEKQTAVPLALQDKLNSLPIVVESHIQGKQSIIHTAYVDPTQIEKGFSGVTINKLDSSALLSYMQTKTFPSKSVLDVIVNQEQQMVPSVRNRDADLARWMCALKMWNLTVVSTLLDATKDTDKNRNANISILRCFTLHTFKEIPDFFPTQSDESKNSFAGPKSLSYQCAKSIWRTWANIPSEAGTLRLAMRMSDLLENTVAQLSRTCIHGAAWETFSPTAWLCGSIGLMLADSRNTISQSALVNYAKACPFSVSQSATMSDAKAKMILFNLLTTPHVKVSRVKNPNKQKTRTAVLNIELPLFIPGYDHLIISFSRQKSTALCLDENMSYKILPSKISQLFDSTGNELINIQFSYSNLLLSDNMYSRKTPRYAAEIQIMAKGYSFPLAPASQNLELLEHQEEGADAKNLCLQNVIELLL